MPTDKWTITNQFIMDSNPFTFPVTNVVQRHPRFRPRKKTDPVQHTPRKKQKTQRNKPIELYST